MVAVSNRARRVKPSATLRFTERARELSRKGLDVISLSAGEPDFDTPHHIIEAAKTALDQGMTRYTPVAGLPELRRAVAEENTRVRGVHLSFEHTIVGVGAKHILYEFFCAVLNPGDEVIIPAPYWVSYPDQVALAGGVPVIAGGNPEAGGILKPEDLEKALSKKSKVLVINSPCNPTGAVAPRDALTKLVEIALDAGLYVISDEIYKDLIYDDAPHVSPLSVAPESQREHIFVVDGVSKTYAMTGFRIGFGIGHPEIIRAISTIQGQSTSNASSPCQAAALAAITSPRSFLDSWRNQYRARRDAMVDALNRIPGIRCPRPEGAFYVLPCVEDVYRRNPSIADDIAFTSFLLENALVAGVPGTPFGAPGHIRFSYATSVDRITEGMARIARALS